MAESQNYCTNSNFGMSLSSFFLLFSTLCLYLTSVIHSHLIHRRPFHLDARLMPDWEPEVVGGTGVTLGFLALRMVLPSVAKVFIAAFRARDCEFSRSLPLSSTVITSEHCRND
ncbi:unnamed protein product [Boreogadus saida]